MPDTNEELPLQSDELKNTSENVFRIDAVLAPKISYATHQGAVPILRELRVANTTAIDTQVITLTLSAVPQIFAPKTWTIEHLKAESAVRIPDLDLALHADVLASLNEAVRADVILRIEGHLGDQLVREEQRSTIELLARNEWGGAKAMPELLASFAQPNDPAIASMLKSASALLAQNDKPDSLEGYQSKSRTRVYEIVSAIWSTVSALRLTYCEPPASFEYQGQKIRTPSLVTDSGLATCLDLAVFFAACCEAAGLYPLIILTEGHAFAGVWLQPDDLVNLLIADSAELRKRIALDELVVFETTLATGARPVAFSRANEAARDRLSEEWEEHFVYALDVRRARMQKIRPLAMLHPAHEAVPTTETATDSATAASSPVIPLESAPDLPDFELPEPQERPSTPQGRLARWQSKLLDLSSRNRLLNVKPGPNTVRLICPDLAAFKDRLSEGKAFRIVALPALEGGAGRDTVLHAERTGEKLDRAYAAQALVRDEVVAALAPESLDATLTSLYRKVQSDLAEGGSNTLYLSIGFLSWKKNLKDAKPYRAPLLLVPVKLERQSVRSGMRLSLHEDEARFNLTLLEMLRHDFDLHIPDLQDALPPDDSGIDIARIFTIVRKAVRETPGFEVVEDVYLGTFSFAKYLMWKDLQDRADLLKENPVVKHLLETPREPYRSTGEAIAPSELDSKIAPAQIFAPLSADSSQLAAVISSARGCDFILDGPPGTGKSQTIANIIAQNLAMGRRILFVAEKQAALDVVHRRLQQHGLGPFCLELHSNKAQKTVVLKQLEHAWSVAATCSNDEWQRRASELQTTRDRLNRFVTALHAVHPNGLTIYRAIGLVARDGKHSATRLNWPNPEAVSAAKFTQLREVAHLLDVHLPENFLELQQQFRGIGRAQWSNAWQSEMLSRAQALQAACASMRSEHEALERSFGIALSRTPEDLGAASAFVRTLQHAGNIDVGFAFDQQAERRCANARTVIGLLRQLATSVGALSAAYSPAMIRQCSLAELENDWRKAERSLWPFRIFARRAVAKRLHPQADVNPAQDFLHLNEAQRLITAIELAAADMPPIAGWAGLESHLASMEFAMDAAEAIRSAVTRLHLDVERLARVEAGLVSHFSKATHAQFSSTYALALKTFQDALASFVSHAEFRAETPIDDVVAAFETYTADVVRSSGHLNAWTQWQRTRTLACDHALESLVADIESGSVAKGQARDAFDLAYTRCWVTNAIDADPLFSQFSAAEQNDVVKRFREFDAQFALLTQTYIQARLASQIPARDAQDQHPGFNVLAHQLTLKKRHKPVRQLIGEMGGALTTLTPCLLMSPLSVAQYLPAHIEPFDLVIFDEASQITPWDAVGAIARGRQLIVAGDPKQMPPTNFFSRTSGDDETNDEPDMESILDECRTARLPERRLTWHYRSQNESLIAFSNHRYYDGDLITFPAPATVDSAVSLRRIDGVWSRGKDRTNQAEAEAIVAEVVKRLRSADATGASTPSIAVITLNAEQQDLVNDLLDKERRRYPEVEAAFSIELAEPIIVKNLETVQGDERDVVLLGIGYGPDTLGAPDMKMNFGPLNRAGGARRLNVAITRARAEMIVFCSFPPGFIDTARTTAEAVRDLKDFLLFAERGRRALNETVGGSLGGYDSPFEQAVARALRDRGWSINTQIGVSRFRIDLGIVHPDFPGDYIAGVECDGASYHSSASARDRDKVREEILRARGWHIERVWSTDWWIDAASVLDRLHAALERRLEADRARRSKDAERLRASAETATPTTASKTVAETTPGGYRYATFEAFRESVVPDAFDEARYTPQLERMLAHVIEIEAPIRLSELIERIARAHGFRRSGTRIAERLTALVRQFYRIEVEDNEHAFAWKNQSDDHTDIEPRYPATSEDVRQIDDISLRELASAISDAPTDDALTDIARQFGVRRLTANARERLRKAAELRRAL